jgi:ribonuclease HI
MENYAAQPDLTDWPLKNSDLELYTDGSSFVKNGVRHAGFAVVTEFGILKSGPLPPNTSAQLAELVALTEALRLSKEQRVNIYTDSKYSFLILHAHAAIWKKREMLTTIGTASHRNKGGYFNNLRDNNTSCSPCWNQLWGDCQSCNCKKPNQSGRGHLRPGRPCH